MSFIGRWVATCFVIALLFLVRTLTIIQFGQPLREMTILGVIAVGLAWMFGFHFDRMLCQSYRDELTQLYNRRYVLRRFPGLLRQADLKSRSLGVIVADVNRLKQINDERGHIQGDDALKGIAEALSWIEKKSSKRIVARIGGDEFLIVIPHADQSMLEEMMQGVEQRLESVSQRIGIDLSLSVGMALYPEDGKTLESLIQASDLNMYSHKMKSGERLKRFRFTPSVTRVE